MKLNLTKMLAALVMLFVMLPMNTLMAFAADTVVASGPTGDCTWTITGDETTGYTLTLSGKGAMEDYSSTAPSPWDTYKASIKNAVIGDGVTNIGDSAFQYHTALTNVSISETVTSIGYSAFHDCTSLTGISIPASVATIRPAAFNGCSNLTAINVAEDNKAYASIDGVLYDKKITQLIRVPEGKSGAYIIPDTVTSIALFAGFGCTSLTEITLSKNITSLPRDFDQFAVNNIYVAEGNDTYASQDGVLFSKDLTTLVKFPSGRSGSYDIPSTTTTILSMAFGYCFSLTEVTIPASVTTIDRTAFNANLTTVNVPHNWDGSIYSFGTKVTVNKSLHEWSYTPNDETDVISASCTLGCGNTITATLKAPEPLVYDGSEKNVTVSYSNDAYSNMGLDVASISYNTTNGKAPVNAGTYTATLTAGEGEKAVSVTVEFTIKKATLDTVPTGLTAVEGQTLNSVKLPDGWTWDDPDADVGKAGSRTHKASYESQNYAVESADVTIAVVPKTTQMEMYSVYSVTHYQQNLDGTYSEVTADTQFPLYGEIGTTVSALPKDYPGFALSTNKASALSTKLAQAAPGADGQPVFTELKLYYDRLVLTITFDTDGGSTVEPMRYMFGEAVTAPANPTKPGYTFAGWTPALPETMPSDADITVTAVWVEEVNPNDTPDQKPGDTDNLPKTGDNSSMTLWLALCIAALAGLGALLNSRKKAAHIH